MKKAISPKDYAIKIATACNLFDKNSFTIDELKAYLKGKNQFNSFITIVVNVLISKALIGECPNSVGREKFYQFTTSEPINYSMFTLEVKKEQDSKMRYYREKKSGPKSVNDLKQELVKIKVESKKLSDNPALIKAIQLCESHGCPVMIPASLLF